MKTYLLMGALFLAISIYTVKGVKVDQNKDSLMSIEDTTFLRGFWCIIVILVHVPVPYQNKLQDMIGSIAYIGVTFFFLISSFGLMYGVEHKKDYLKNFWWKRLSALLVPMLFCNFLSMTLEIFESHTLNLLNLVRIDSWVRVLLLYYFLFWIIKAIPLKSEWGGHWKDAIICITIVVISFCGRLLNRELPLWFTESYGFAYGIILYDSLDRFKKWSKRKWVVKEGIFFILSITLGVLYLKFKPVNFLGDYCLKIILGFCIVMLVLLLLCRVSFGNGILTLLYKISYEIYLLHHLSFRILIAVFAGLNSGIFIWLAIGMTIGLAVIVRTLSGKVLVQLNRIIKKVDVKM